MKRVMYVLGMTLALCCCSTKEEKSPDSVTTEVKSESNVKHLYSFYDFCQENPGCEISGFKNRQGVGIAEKANPGALFAGSGSRKSSDRAPGIGGMANPGALLAGSGSRLNPERAPGIGGMANPGALLAGSGSR